MRCRAFLTIAVLALGATRGLAQEPDAVDSLETRVWVDRGDDPVVQRGDEVRVYYRTSGDAYAAIFRIDTDGVISLLFPQDPTADVAVRGGRDYRLLFPRSPRWRVEEDPGVGYFFMVASPEPLDFSAFSYDEERGWDLGEVGATVYEDPYVAIDDYVAAIVPEWEFVPYALDFLTYNVGDTHSYPRFLCYDCHGYQSYSSWNPYTLPCTSYQVVIWDDPYFYPQYRYRGTRVVFARPFGPRPRYGVTARVAGAGWGPLVRTRSAPPSRVIEYKESARSPSYQPRNPVPRSSTTEPTRRPSTAAALPTRTRPPTTARGATGITPPRATRATPQAGRTQRVRGATTPRASAGTSRPTLRRRPPAPSARLPARGSTSNRVATSTRGATGRATTGSRPATVGSSRSRSPGRVVRPPTSRPRAVPARPPTNAVPRGAVPRGAAPRGAAPRSATSGRSPSAARRPAAARPPRTTSRPSTGNRPTTTSRPSARPTTRRPPTRARPTPRRRPGGRGGG